MKVKMTSTAISGLDSGTAIFQKARMCPAPSHLAASSSSSGPEQIGRLVGLETAVDDGADLVVGQDLDLDLGAPGRLEVGGDLLEGRDLLVRAPGREGGGARQLTAAVTAPRLRP
jgi:hypothetical protein